jgi:hypothetical protein
MSGRIGDLGTGVFQSSGFYSLEEAKANFKDTFQQKTRHTWENRHKFERVKGCWNLVKKLYDVEIDEEQRKKDFESSRLPHSVKELLNVITDSNLIRRYQFP